MTRAPEGQAVASQVRHPVVILYQHALLGEGIARYLLAQVGVVATVASALDPLVTTGAEGIRVSDRRRLHLNLRPAPHGSVSIRFGAHP